MIVLKVEAYCHGCVHFDPDIIRAEKLYSGPDVGVSIRIGDDKVVCARKDICNHIYSYLEARRDE